MGTPFADRWPRWPQGVAGKQVLAVQVGCSVDALFELAFAGESDFTVDPAPVQLISYVAHDYLLPSFPSLSVSGPGLADVCTGH